MIDRQELESLLAGASAPQLEKIQGPDSFQAARVDRPEDAGPASLVFASTPEQLRFALQNAPALLILQAKLEVPAGAAPHTAIFRTPSIGLAMAALLPAFDTKSARFQQETTRHPSAVVHPRARVHASAVLGPGVVIGEDAQLEEGVIIGANSVIERGARIGARSLLHPLVFVGAECEIGTDCEIHPHTTIGSDGFGFAQDKAFKHHKLPQLGRVVIGDRVEIGANCAIDRAAFTETRIGSGTKLDNLCHVAHNCEVGEDSVIAAGFFMAGSSKIGKRFMVGGTSALADHVNVGDDVILAGRSVIVNDLPNKGAYGGYPVQPMKDYLKTLSSLPHVVRLRKDVSRIMKHLGLSED